MKTKFQSTEVNTIGELPKVGQLAPSFTLVAENLADVSLNNFIGTKIILNIFPSLDTSVCAMSVRRFNQIASTLPNTKILCISKDLPFAQKRFCTTEGLEDVVPLSDMRSESNFGKDYGVLISDSPLSGLFARAVIAISEDGKITYASMNKEITDEPNYDAILKAISE